MEKQLAINGGARTLTETLPAWPVFGKEEEEALLSVLRSGRWGRLEGESVTDRFEQKFAEDHGCKHGIACTNGTISLRLALMAIDIQPGDEVIVPPFTFLATATCVIEANGAPVFVDIEPDTYNIDPKAIERAITPRTKAIIPVHLAGLPADMDAIMEIANRHGLYVIEDAAHAHGAQYKGRPCGSLGHLASFSFQSTKNMSSGEGGIVTTNDDKLAHMVRSLHNCGREPGHPWYRHFRMAGNYRITEFQSAILECQLARLEAQTIDRDAKGRRLAERINKIPGLATQPLDPAFVTRHAFHIYVIRYDESVFGVPRKLFVEAVQAEGLPLAEGYPIALNHQPLFQDKQYGPYHGYKAQVPDLDPAAAQCPVTDHASLSEATWFHHGALLGSDRQIHQFAEIFEKVHANREELREVAAGR